MKKNLAPSVPTIFPCKECGHHRQGGRKGWFCCIDDRVNPKETENKTYLNPPIISDSFSIQIQLWQYDKTNIST